MNRWVLVIAVWLVACYSMGRAAKDYIRTRDEGPAFTPTTAWEDCHR
jgi:hypothetical protein